MKHRVVNFTDKFENVVSDGYINEEFINCDSFDENNGFIKEENINGNISENDNDNPNNGRNNYGNINSSNLNYDESAERRYPKRNSKPPVHLNDYDLNNEEDKMNFVDYFYLLNIPVSYDVAMKSDDSLKWKLAMDDKMKSLKLYGTYKLVDLPESCKLIGGKWVSILKVIVIIPFIKHVMLPRAIAKCMALIILKHFHLLHIWIQLEH